MVWLKMFDLRKRYKGAVEAMRSPEPVYAFVSPQGIVDYFNLINNDKETFVPNRLLSSFQLGGFRGRFRPGGNAIDWLGARMKFERKGGRTGSYPLERIEVGAGGERERIGMIHVATNYTHFKGVEERFEDIRLELEREVKLIYDKIPVMAGGGFIGLTVIGEVGYPPRTERNGYTLISATTNLEPNAPGCVQMFPSDIFLKEEWKTRKK